MDPVIVEACKAPWRRLATILPFTVSKTVSSAHCSALIRPFTVLRCARPRGAKTSISELLPSILTWLHPGPTHTLPFENCKAISVPSGTVMV
ncbi:MAG: hypothetical protein BWY09_02642 [Candidatus Hydrogenedentes bacterium ADurb.Bin179]|nr:MAG: hypothetical protein BWY09_02642 [Candidatus Hydrogenedentes bacterium ADurb.Bin179]